MSILIDQLPESVEIGGSEIAISTDFRIGILFSQLWEDPDYSATEKAEQSIRLYYPDMSKIPLGYAEEVFNRIMWFYRCGDKRMNRRQRQIQAAKEGTKGISKSKRFYDYDYDADLIVAAFRQVYHIDLTSASLHWWTFRALFEGLTDDTKFVTVMGYRAKEITSKMSKEEQRFYAEMQEIYALPVSVEEEEKESAIERAIKAGDTVALMKLVNEEIRHGQN